MNDFDFTRDLDSISQDFRQLSLSQQIFFLEALENYRYQLLQRHPIFDSDPVITSERLDYVWRMLSHYLLNAGNLNEASDN